MTRTHNTDVAIIGAGPAGSMAAAMLRKQGWRVTVIERSHFPRFSIGEGLLPHCMDLLDQADMLAPLEQAAFQIKTGAAFAESGKFGRSDFADKYYDGWDTTWHVLRAEFDHILATQAAERGADVRFGESIDSVDFGTPGAPRIDVVPEDGEPYQLEARFVCDASGFGRVLPRMLGLDRPVDAPPRGAIFTHVEDRISAPHFRRDNTLVSIHPQQPDVWYWMIPFSNGRTSIGVVGSPEFIDAQPGESLQQLQALMTQEPCVAELLGDAVYDSPVRRITSYAADVTALHGRDYALLGNAGGFIDPIFSSGVTMALKSAVLAGDLVDRQLRDQPADWDMEFEAPLRAGSRVFGTFVKAWYDGALKHVFFKQDVPADVRGKLISVLAGYVWDADNPYVARPEKRLRALCDACAP